MYKNKNKILWYTGGLNFECRHCGRCCSGPDEGVIWVRKQEVKIIADFLKKTVGHLRQKYLKRIGLRTTIVEKPGTKDCVFLQEIDGQKKCTIYPVRPNQCRMWPFWPSNLVSPNAWNEAVRRCGGINSGKSYSFEEVEAIRKNKK